MKKCILKFTQIKFNYASKNIIIITVICVSCAMRSACVPPASSQAFVEYSDFVLCVYVKKIHYYIAR